VATGGSIAMDPEGKRVPPRHRSARMFMARRHPGADARHHARPDGRFYRAWKNDYPRMPARQPGPSALPRSAKSIWGLLLIVIVLGGHL